jgi:hypothetical protein
MFDRGSVYLGSVVKKVAVTLVFLLILQALSVIISPSIHRTHSHLLVTVIRRGGHAVMQLDEALRYKPEGRGFDSQ